MATVIHLLVLLLLSGVALMYGGWIATVVTRPLMETSNWAGPYSKPEKVAAHVVSFGLGMSIAASFTIAWLTLLN